MKVGNKIILNGYILLQFFLSAMFFSNEGANLYYWSHHSMC